MAETPTYHIDIWTVPEPTYVCALCIPTARYTLEEVTAHLREVHNADAIPTPNMNQLLALRTASDQRAAEAAAAIPTPGAPPPEPAAPPAPESQAEAAAGSAPSSDESCPSPAQDAPTPAPGQTPATPPAPSPEETHHG